jgi:hypothetical protein
MAHRLFLMEHPGHRSINWNSDTAYVGDDGGLRLFYDDDPIEFGDAVGRFEWFELGDDNQWRTSR